MMGQNNNIPRVQLTVPWALPLPIGVGEGGDGSLPGGMNAPYSSGGVGSPEVIFDPNSKAGIFYDIDIYGAGVAPGGDSLTVSLWLCVRGANPNSGTLLWQAVQESDMQNEPFICNWRVQSCGGAGNFTCSGLFNWRNINADFGETWSASTIAAANYNKQLIIVPTFQWATNANGNLFYLTNGSAKKYSQFAS